MDKNKCIHRLESLKQRINQNEFNNKIDEAIKDIQSLEFAIKFMTDKKEEDKNTEVRQRITAYLNEKCGTRYRASTPATVKHINARLSDGYSEQDFYTVIDKKCDDWLGTTYEQYLRPNTLFGTKFESYLNQNIIKRKPQNFDGFLNS